MDMTQLETSTALAGSLVRTGHLNPSLPQVMDTTHSEGMRRQYLKDIKQALNT